MTSHRTQGLLLVYLTELSQDALLYLLK
uniref:Uncharacterized protein n=1 Tax=Anguilla anguilla TaxID=7936 RepID=A0A0E9XNP9_ANGAN